MLRVTRKAKELVQQSYYLVHGLAREGMEEMPGLLNTWSAVSKSDAIKLWTQQDECSTLDTKSFLNGASSMHLDPHEPSASTDYTIMRDELNTSPFTGSHAASSHTGYSLASLLFPESASSHPMRILPNSKLDPFYVEMNNITNDTVFVNSNTLITNNPI